MAALTLKKFQGRNIPVLLSWFPQKICLDRTVIAALVVFVGRRAKEMLHAMVATGQSSGETQGSPLLSSGFFLFNC